MKCANCGAEIRVGCVYCPVCGKEAQIVSDYNILEDDYLDSLLQEGEKPSVPSKSKQKEKAAKPKQEKPTGKKSKKSLYIVIFILLFVAAFAPTAGFCLQKAFLMKEGWKRRRMPMRKGIRKSNFLCEAGIREEKRGCFGHMQSLENPIIRKKKTRQQRHI